jgi:hypothetical protein
MKKMWAIDIDTDIDIYRYITEYYFAIKNEIISFSVKWDRTGDHVTQAQKTKYCMFSLKYGI